MRLSIIISITALIVSVFAQIPGTWETFGDANRANCIASYNGALYVGTKGGVLKYIPGQEQSEWEIMTNIHGLGGLNVINLNVFDGELYYAASNGAVGRLEGNEWATFSDLIRDELGINDLVTSGEFIYVATEQGISALRPLPGSDVIEVAENYTKLGGYDRNMAMTAVTADDTLLWAGGDIGLAWGRIGNNLYVPEAWDTFTTDRPIEGIFADSGGVWVALEREDGEPPIYYFDGDSLRPIGGEFMLGRYIDGFFYYDNEFYAFGIGGLYKMTDPDEFTRIRTDEHWTVHGGAALGDSFYVGMDIGFGVIRQDTIRHKSPNSPSGDAFMDVDVAPNGDVWVVSKSKGVCRYSNGVWTNFNSTFMERNTSDSIYTQIRDNIHHVSKIAVDGYGKLWMGMTGDGVFCYSSGGEWEIFDKTNSVLNGYSASPDAPLCWGLDFDSQSDLMWISNYDNITGLAVAAFVPGTGMDSPAVEYYTGSVGMPNNYVLSVTAGRGNVWLVLRDQGVTLVDPGYYISDYSDDYVHNYSSELPSASVGGVSITSDGIAWVGVSGGVVTIDPSINLVVEQSLPEHVSTFISDIIVDDDENVWITSDNGAAVFRRSDSTWMAIRSRFAQDVYEYERTDLGTELLYSVTFNPVTGDVWFCGENMISVLHTSISGADSDGELIIYPNPIIWTGYATEVVTIAGVPQDAEVYIYSPDGSLIRQIRLDERTSISTAEWNCRNESGKPVASGVYIVVAASGDKTFRTKAAVIRADG